MKIALVSPTVRSVNMKNFLTENVRPHFMDVTKTGNGERGAGNGERKSGNELSAETSIKIQYGR